MSRKFVRVFFYITICTMICAGKNYGGVNVVISKVEVCKGPKRFDCTIETAEITSNYSFKYTLSLKDDFNLTSGKIIGTQNGKDMMRFRMKKPCDNLLINRLLKAYINISDDCMASKGDYEFTVDLYAISQKYYNGVFMYGNWTFKSVLHGNSCNFLCNTVELLLAPGNKQ